ncbi:lyase family protein, partial [Nonomuraea lactucae]|uniref:lyase family protein n=1 Tax=Nonomuraea lactucae TaxID=2249762 RepID=UPI0023DD2895
MSRVADGLTADPVALARRARHSASPVIPLVADLRAAVTARAREEPVTPAREELVTPAREELVTPAREEVVTPPALPGGDPAAFVHRGATSQDIVDSAAMLVASRAVGAIVADLDRAMRSLAGLADRHRGTVMAARTLGQHAVPTTFGLKAAGWLAGLLRADERLRALRFPAQLGGAA